MTNPDQKRFAARRHSRVIFWAGCYASLSTHRHPQANGGHPEQAGLAIPKPQGMALEALRRHSSPSASVAWYKEPQRILSLPETISIAGWRVGTLEAVGEPFLASGSVRRKRCVVWEANSKSSRRPMGSVAGPVAILGLAVLGFTDVAATQSLVQIFLASPGERFGPLEIDALPPPFPDVTCRDSGLGIVKLHYSPLGMSAMVRDSAFNANTETEGHVFAVAAVLEAVFYPDALSSECVDPRGDTITQTIRLGRAESAGGGRPVAGPIRHALADGGRSGHPLSFLDCGDD